MEPLFLADCHGGTEWHEGLGETCLTGVQPNNPQLLKVLDPPECCSIAPTCRLHWCSVEVDLVIFFDVVEMFQGTRCNMLNMFPHPSTSNCEKWLRIPSSCWSVDISNIPLSRKFNHPNRSVGSCPSTVANSLKKLETPWHRHVFLLQATATSTMSPMKRHEEMMITSSCCRASKSPSRAAWILGSTQWKQHPWKDQAMCKLHEWIMGDLHKSTWKVTLELAKKKLLQELAKKALATFSSIGYRKATRFWACSQILMFLSVRLAVTVACFDLESLEPFRTSCWLTMIHP